MARHVAHVFFQAIPTLLAVSICVFLLLQAIPGGPLSAYENDPEISEEDLIRLKAKMGLDASPIEQYAQWLQNVLKGDMGWSFMSKRPVIDMILERLPNTLLLMGTSILIGLVIAFPIGILSAQKQYSLIDQIATTLAFIGQSMPIFWFGLIVIIIFSLKLELLPSGGMYTIGAPFSIFDRLKYLALPAFVMGTTLAGRYIRFVRGSTLEVIHADFVRTARAKGLTNAKVMVRHILKNAASPIVTVISLDLPMLFGGSVYTEQIFSWPGTGRLFFRAADQRDYPVLMAMIMVTAILIISFNLLADVLYAVLDPRVRYS